jgi:hypothetical protein
MSLPEVLIAFLLIMVVVLGLVPLFARSMISNTSGNNSSVIASYARARAEEFYQLDFNSVPMTVTSGTELEHFEAFDGDLWQDIADPTNPPAGTEWLRTTTVRQFSSSDVTLATPLDATAAIGSVHMKEIVVEIESSVDGGILGPRKGMSVRIVKSQ